MAWVHLYDEIQGIDDIYHTHGGYDAEGAAEARKWAVLQRRNYVPPDLKNMPYEEFLRSEYWLALAKWLKRRSLWRCLDCKAHLPPVSGEHYRLQVHHLTYAHRGDEYPNHLEDLVVLCDKCHARRHRL